MADKDAIVIRIGEKGDEIRKLKEGGATKDDLQPHIAQLSALKAEYKAATGEDYAAPGQGSSRKDKKKKEEGAPAGGGDADRKKAKEMRRQQKEQEKKAQKESKPVQAAAAENGAADDKWRYGDSPLIQSQEMTDKVYLDLHTLTPERDNSTVWVRARVQTIRPLGKGVFLLLRQSMATVQAVLFAKGEFSKNMVQYAASVVRESVVDVKGRIRLAPTPVESATQRLVELHIEEIHIVNAVESDPPFLIEDAARPEKEEGEPDEEGQPRVGQDTKLNYRWLDLRTPANQAIFRIQSGVCQLFRNFLSTRGFIEIHSPKLQGGASEGGANVFKLDYFGQPACLAQSPQLYKQMTAACGGFGRVYEVGPVFRAEFSNTHRHLCEFTGLDFEMTIQEHYYEVLEVFSDLFIHIFDNLNTAFAAELAAVNAQFPFEPLKYCRPTLRLTFQEGIQMLRDAGYNASFDEDLNTENEKALGRLVREKYDTDFFMMDKYPLGARPFYTMPCPENAKLSNSFDIFIRGEEIVSGAQRIHELGLLIERAKHWDISLDSIQAYLDAFRHGAEPHGGGGIGLERVVMLFLGLKNIRKASLFPRDPKRIAP